MALFLEKSISLIRISFFIFIFGYLGILPASRTLAATSLLTNTDTTKRADVDSWKVAKYGDLTKCGTRARLVIKGDHFYKDSKVKIGGTKMSSMKRNSSKKLTATICLSKLLKVKTDPKRYVYVKNPNTDPRKSEKRLDVTAIPWKSASDNFDQDTVEGTMNIQKMLQNLGLLSAENMTGYYGPITAEAVKKFQSQHGIPTTGNVGPLTIAAFK